jgi:hypothetical protein
MALTRPKADEAGRWVGEKISTHLVVGEFTAPSTPEVDEDGDPEEDGGDDNPDGLGVELENGILSAAYLLQSPRVRNRVCLIPLLAFLGEAT